VFKVVQCNLSEDEEVFNREDDPDYAERLASVRHLPLSRLVEAEDDLLPKTHPY